MGRHYRKRHLGPETRAKFDAIKTLRLKGHSYVQIKNATGFAYSYVADAISIMIGKGELPKMGKLR